MSVPTGIVIGRQDRAMSLEKSHIGTILAA